MSKDGFKIISVRFRDRTEIGLGNEWTSDNPHGYLLSEEGNELVFTTTLDGGLVRRVRVPKSNVAFVVEHGEPTPAPKETGRGGGGKGKEATA